MRRVKCRSGLTGWQQKLRANYDNDFAKWERYSDTYGLAERLGFASAEEAWEKNPTIQGSVVPSDFRVVRAKRRRSRGGR